MTRPDVVVIGGGVAGGALANGLVRRGMSVVVLERAERFEDRVRGEYLAPWGVAEAKRLGVLDDIDERSQVLRTMRLVDSADVVDDTVDLTTCAPGADGARGIAHPELCDVLLAGARRHGAVVHMGVDAVVELGSDPAVRFADGSVLRPRIVIGADGIASVVRAAAGWAWSRRAPTVLGAGLAVRGLCEADHDVAIEGTAGDVMSYLIPQREGRARLYLNYAVDAGPSFLGSPRASGFLDAYPKGWAPTSKLVAAGPCRVVPLTDGEPSALVGRGAALIGDAAGHCNPILGQGLAIAMRDANLVSEILASGDAADWEEALETRFVLARRELLRRMRVTADAIVAAAASFGPDGGERRAAIRARGRSNLHLAALLLAPFTGPHQGDEFTFSPIVLRRLLDPPPSRVRRLAVG